jgi:arylsulfatase A-like enzyme
MHMKPIGVGVFAWLFMFVWPAQSAEKPNVVFLLADDLGYGDLKCYGHPYARTPNLDRLASQGTRFTQCYATGVTCCPARTGLMTGRFPATFKEYPSAYGFGARPTITELLKQAGYRAGHFGKWHIGPDTKPGTYGIDTINADEDTPGKKKRDPAFGRDHSIYESAIAFIEKNQAGPFYVNVWGHISHNPVNPTANLVERWKDQAVQPRDFPMAMREKFTAVEAGKGDITDGMRKYLAEVEALDADVGRLLAKLDALGLSKNTIVVFSSDQGADMTKAGQGGLRFNQMGFNGPHKGGKHTHYEGGVRIPWIVRWPGHVPANMVNEKSVLSGADWLPTLCAITGVKLPALEFDGEDRAAVWQGAVRERTKPLYWKVNNVRSEVVVRDGPWKFFLPGRKRDETELYRIVTDPAEAKNVLKQEPEIARRLRTLAEAWNAKLPKEYLKADDND